MPLYRMKLRNLACCRLLRQSASKFLLDDLYRNPGPLQFEGPGGDAKAVSLCVEDQDYMGRIKKLQEYLDKVIISDNTTFVFVGTSLFHIWAFLVVNNVGLLIIMFILLSLGPNHCKARMLSGCSESSFECHGFGHRRPIGHVILIFIQ